MNTLFIICCLVIIYTYMGYGLLLYVLVSLKKLFNKKHKQDAPCELPAITLLIAAYNEEACIDQKIRNSLSLVYPEDKLQLLIVTDGSTDATPAIVSRYPQVQLLHRMPRAGKACAINRGMENVSTAIVVFSDANTLLNETALLEIAKQFCAPGVGAVAGEKRIVENNRGGAAGTEGLYWRVESRLKMLESAYYSVMGAAGELFGIRTNLFQPIPEDTLLDDLVVSLRIAGQGYSVQYVPTAYAVEPASGSTSEEFRRKVRMAAGGLQTFLRFKHLLLFRRPLLSFTFISHRVLRWLVAPYLLPAAFILNLIMVCSGDAPGLLQIVFVCQMTWYVLALAGALLDRYKRDAGLFFLPYYFCLMNYAMVVGIWRFARAKQDVLWEKAHRRNSS